MGIYWLAKYVIFNSGVSPVSFRIPVDAVSESSVRSDAVWWLIAVGQAALLIYDKAYQYVQGTLWEKWRKRIL